MKGKKGLTLIEVVLSMFIIGLIATAFIPSLFSNFSMLFRTREITKNIFEAKQDLERSIELVKNGDYLSDGNKFQSETFNLFGKEIEGVLINQPISGEKKIVAFVPIISEDIQEIVIKEPRVEAGTVGISPLGPIYGFKEESLKGSRGKLDEGSRDYYNLSIFNWYVSKPGFEGFIPGTVNNVNEGYFGTRYPQWPHDYVKVKTSYNVVDILNDLKEYVEDYQGRHIIFSEIPVSRIGKYGTEEPSQPVYLIGLPVLDSLSLHLDVDTIQEEINTKEEKNLFWSDVSKHDLKTNVEVKLKYDEDLGKFIEIEELVTIPEPRSSERKDITFFIVFNNTSLEVDKIQNLVNSSLGDNLEWQLNMNKGKIEFIIGKEENQIKLNTETFFDNNKHILAGQISKNNGVVKLFVDNEEKTFTGDTDIFNSSPSVLSIGDDNSKLNLYEIIIYNSALSEEEINSVRKYLARKHRIELK